MNNILEKIKAYKVEEVCAAKAQLPLEEIKQRLKDQSNPLRGFKKKLEDTINKNEIGLIAEIKKASPTKGLIRDPFSPKTLAHAFELGGASCLSVLTDSPSFQGNLSFLAEARSACTLPILRKDFLLDPYQIYEARLYGADCILLILAMIDDPLAQILEETAHFLGMDVLIEIHNLDEMERALKLTSALIGINNRNLHDFTINLDNSKHLAAQIKTASQHQNHKKILISESGIHSYQECQDLQQSDIHCFLVGESLMRQPDVMRATQRLLQRT